MKDDSDKSNAQLEVRFGKTRLALQISILTILLFLAGYFTLWSDTHNDGRYVKKEDYEKDRVHDREMQGQVINAVTYRLDRTDRKIDDLSQEIRITVLKLHSDDHK